MANDPLAELFSQWKSASDAAMKAWQEGLDQLAASPAAEEATREFSRNFTGASARMREASKQAAEPIVEMAGGVPMSEFRRLMDQLHSVLLRLDGIEDALQRIETRLDAADLPPRPKKKSRAK